MRQLLCGVVLLSISCGSKSPPPEPATPPAEPAETGEPAARPAASPIEKACARMTAVHRETPCRILEVSGFEPDQCVASFEVEQKTPELQRALDAVVACLGEMTRCDDLRPCYRPYGDALEAASGPTRECGKVGIGYIALDAAAAARRHGQGASKLSQIASSKAQPIELCGIDAQHAWLLAARCDDGSAPFTSRAQVAAARVKGSVGYGGRCASTIDKYDVRCPEKTYEVFMDMYMCGPGESF